MNRPARRGVLAHLTVIEFAGLGPAPFAAMMLADHGARVIRIDRPPHAGARDAQEMYGGAADVLARGRESIALNLKNRDAQKIVLRLVERADALIEGYRPGVMESLGLGPDVCMDRRASLVYARVTGWGQDGPLARTAGHDINFTALTGTLSAIGRPGLGPTPAAGLIGDFGGGGMLAAFGILAAIIEANQTGHGQVVDVSACDGSALLAALIQGWRSAGLWSGRVGTNMGDGGAHFFNAYECADGRYISIGSIEPQFYAALREHCGLTDPSFEQQWDRTAWSELKVRMEEVFKLRTQAQWCKLFEGSDICFAPVLNLDDAPHHPHNLARKTYATVSGITQPAPAPKFVRTPAAPCQAVHPVGSRTLQLLLELGFKPVECTELIEEGAIWAAQDQP